MKALVVGSGGREHCLMWKLSLNPAVKDLYCAPGNAGTSFIGKNVPLDTIDDIVRFACKESIDLTVVGPEAPLAEGIVDRLSEQGCKVIGPKQSEARLESSKIFAKNFMRRNNIPTADYEVFHHPNRAAAYIHSLREFPVVMKADGLAAGKGVAIVDDRDDALLILRSLMVERKFGKAGEKIVIEEFLSGEEATIILALDDDSFCLLPSSQDHKKVGEGDIGPNTGGMGAYSPAPIVTAKQTEKIEQKIVLPLVEGLKKEGMLYKGFLYIGIIVSDEGEPFVLEFNVRLGDPETQVVIPRLENDLLEMFNAIIEGELHAIKVQVDPRPMLGVVMAAHGYPGNYERGMEISGLERFSNSSMDDVLIFHAGTKRKEGKVIANGGRVLNVCGKGNTLREAMDKVYKAMKYVHFASGFYRHDIGFHALTEEFSHSTKKH